MDYDLLVRNVWVENPDLCLVDIGINNGFFATIQPTIPSHGKTEIDGRKRLASPPFIDPHTHLDKALLKPEENLSGTLDEAIRIMVDNKSAILKEDFETRVEQILYRAVKNGTSVIRTHVDVSNEIGTKSIERLKKIKDRWQNVLDLQITAFPQDGVVQQPGMLQQLRSALERGADQIGGIPALESTNIKSRQHIDSLFEIAIDYDVDVDMHIDESDKPSDRTLEMLADATMQAGWQGRVNAAHCCALAAYDDSYANFLIDKVKEAEITIISNPTINLVLQGRDDAHPKRRGITRVKELIAAGVNVTCGSDNVQDVFYPFGQSDMLETSFVLALAAQLTGKEEIRTVLNMSRFAAAKALGLQSYGIAIGCPANLLLMDAVTPAEILSTRPPRSVVVRNGIVLCETTTTTRFHTDCNAIATPSSKAAFQSNHGY